MAAEPVISYLRIRVVNTRAINFSDGFETAAGSTSTLWHSLGTEAGTDNSIAYWTNVNGAAWSFASHLASSPASGTDNILSGGHADWGIANGGVTFEQRVNTLVTGCGIMACVGGTGDGYLWEAGGANNLGLFKRVAGVYTQIGAGQSFTFTQGNPVWLKINVAAAGAITCSAALDSAGAPGTYTNFSFTDSTFTSGKVGLRDPTGVAHSFGGAFANVSRVTGTGPDGWYPVVTTGEPAFALSAVSPQAGTYSASIQIGGSSSGNGSWARGLTQTLAGNNTLACQIKASAGTANASAGGVTTTNGTSSFANQTAQAQMTQNPTAQLNYSGAIGTAYFDTLSITIDPSVGEITNDLPHMHQTHIDVRAMQPGNPGSTALGSWSCQLFPPGTEQFTAAKPIYDKLDYIQRLEFYISPDGASLGKLYYAGVITGIRKGYGQNPVFELSGVSDLFWANYSKPAPGELLKVGYGSGLSTTATYRQARHYFGSNELGVSDTFNPFTAANYTSTTFAGGTAGTWSSSTDDGLNVVSCSTGTGAALLAKSGAASVDGLNQQFVEVSGRLLTTSTDTTNAGGTGIGISISNGNTATSWNVLARAKWNSSTQRYDMDVLLYVSGSVNTTYSNAFTSVDDPEGFIPLTVALMYFEGSGNLANLQVIVNGKVLSTSPVTPGGAHIGALTAYPFLCYVAPASGAATAYLTNLVQQIRYADDGSANAALFKPGTVGSPTHSLPINTDPGPTFLDIITRAATREGWYWRYTPQAFSVGVRTIGTFDFTTDPGADRGNNKSVVFSRADGNLVELQLTANADQLAGGTYASSVSTTDGGGIAVWRDVSTMTKYGVFDDQALAVILPNYAEQRRAALQIVANKIALSSAGSKTATILRDPQTADVWRELDKVMLDDKEMGIFQLVARVIGYAFDEGQPTQTLTLDQFSVDDPTLPARRFQQGVFQTTLKFGNR